MSFHLRCALGYVVVISLMVSWSACHGGKVLVVPLEGSHWVNMDIFIKALHSKGHEVTVVRTSRSWYIKEESVHYNSITVQVEDGVDEDFIKPILDKIIAIERGQSSMLNFLSMQLEAFSFMSKVPAMVCDMVTNMFNDEDLMATLKETQYDLVLTDPGWGGGILLARYLQLPLVYNVRWVTSGEGHLAISPSPLSYIPITGSGNSDKMTFTERVKNLLFYVLAQTQHKFLIQPYYQAVCDKYLNGADYNELLRGADLWLMRVDFVFEFPRPTMPNVIYMGGFQCKPAKPLPQDLEEFVQSSGEHGVIIMSLGTFVGELPQDLADEIAAAFSQLPQKVIWRYKGSRPATLGNNTLIVDWMPQNDLLGHPKLKAFVAHGGTNGVQEALYHGVPVVGLPLFFDQYDNLLRLKERGAAKLLSMATVDKENNFLRALQEVLQEPSYRLNMQRLSRLHKDQPMKPLDSALFWIEFVMRHKGASHLRTESYKMPWYVYHSIDVMALLLTIGIISMLIVAAVLRSCFRMCLKQKVKYE
ncbi:UDP-glucuronosyltransferase 2A1-like [Hypomesus transpacificus]|uniref:UDP-glucuronosyltransferase 2A1-like n=1 Tax=Hypomesus transpacificus TaxID=137520 RepID=UPI001F0854FE|nr:UDP-glucuronosyltransferase 2A1-like [Hypomesus transpacificus]XP_046898732.1 UDP-glucuronosyltransferase 2A1-like [Hypomesus transpacificus]